MPRRRAFDPEKFEARVAVRRQIMRVGELERLGLSRSTVYHRCRAGGPWQLALPGVVATFSGPLAVGHRLVAAIRFAGGGAVVTGVAALRLSNVKQLPADNRVHVLVPHRRRRASTGFVLVERTRRVPDHVSLFGIPCAPIARAVIDASRRMRDRHEVRAMVAEVVQRQLCTVRELADELKAAQRQGSALPRRVLREVAAGVRSVVEAEAREIILEAGLPEPLWNHDVYDGSGRWLGRPDAIWAALGVILEIDSLEWHLSPASYLRTQARQRRLAKHGLIVLPVAPGWMRANRAAFVQELQDALAAGAARPAPEIMVRPAPEAA